MVLIIGQPAPCKCVCGGGEKGYCRVDVIHSYTHREGRKCLRIAHPLLGCWSGGVA